MSRCTHICRATLEGIAYQVADLVGAMNADAPYPLDCLRVDGGASVSDFMMQYQADLLKVPVDRPALVESTAFGAAALAGLGAGIWTDLSQLESVRQTERLFVPGTDRTQEYAVWQEAVQRAAKWAQEE